MGADIDCNQSSLQQLAGSQCNASLSGHQIVRHIARLLLLETNSGTSPQSKDHLEYLQDKT